MEISLMLESLVHVIQVEQLVPFSLPILILDSMFKNQSLDTCLTLIRLCVFQSPNQIYMNQVIVNQINSSTELVLIVLKEFPFVMNAISMSQPFIKSIA